MVFDLSFKYCIENLSNISLLSNSSPLRIIIDAINTATGLSVIAPDKTLESIK